MICSQTTLVIDAKVGPGLLAIVRVTFGARGPFGSATLSIHEQPVTVAQVTVPSFLHVMSGSRPTSVEGAPRPLFTLSARLWMAVNNASFTKNEIIGMRK